MAVMTFAAIDIGSYEVSMKIFELSKRIGFRELNDVRYSLELGKGAYANSRIDTEMLDVLCEILNDFKRLMKDFGVTEYRACGTSAFRELANPLITVEQILRRTGLKIEVLSSAEQHFLGYKSIAAVFSHRMGNKGTAAGRRNEEKSRRIFHTGISAVSITGRVPAYTHRRGRTQTSGIYHCETDGSSSGGAGVHRAEEGKRIPDDLPCGR